MILRKKFFLSVITCLFITGCWDRKEVKDLAIVTASGLDFNEDRTVTQSVQIAIPTPQQSSGSSSNSKSFFVIAAKGKTISDARQQLQQKIHLKLYYSHRRVIIVGERMARHGLEKVFDSFDRETDMRMRNMVFVAKSTNAESLLNYPVALEAVPADQFQNLHKQPSGRATTILNFDATASSEGIEPIMGAFEVIQKKSFDDSSPSSSTGSEPHIKLYGVGIFKKLKLIGYFNEEETRAMNLATKNMSGAYITTYVPEGHGNVSVQILKSEHSYHPQIEGSTIHMNVSIQSECELIENETNLDFSDPNNVKLLNALLSSTINQSVENSVKKSQKLYKSDVFGFGRQLHVKYPKEWKRISSSWNEVYPNIKVDIQTKISVIGTGYTKLPLYRKQKAGDTE